ncbi:hypothetical protein D9M69_599870 [compost metagenome]
MPSASTCLGPSTSVFMPGLRPSLRAASPSMVGVAWLAGRFAHSLANSTPTTWALPTSKPRCTSPAFATPTTTCLTVRALALGLVVV